MNLSDNPTGKVLEDGAGLELTSKLMNIGDRIWNLERMILVRGGIERMNDYPVDRTLAEALQGPREAKEKYLPIELYEACRKIITTKEDGTIMVFPEKCT